MGKQVEQVATATAWDQIEIGDQVKHVKWGVGTVLFRSGMGEQAKAIIIFSEEGQKKVMLRYANLVKVGTTSLKSVEKMRAEIAEPKPKTRAKPKAKAVAKKPVEEPEGEEVSLEIPEIGDDESLAIKDEESEVAGFDEDETEEVSDKDEGDKSKP